MNILGIMVVLLTLIIPGGASSQAGPSISVAYDLLPYQGISEPIVMEDGSLVDDAQVKLIKYRATLRYPVFLSGGRTILANEVSYQGIEFDYRRTTSLLERLHQVSYSLTLLHRISEKWSVLALAKSSLASDFKADISEDDLSFQGAAVFNRHFSEELSMGIGAAYSTQFGVAVPIPVIAVDWNDGDRWSANALLPSGLELWYKADRRLDLGLLVTGDGDNYNFDPGEYQAERPELRYTMLTIGLAAKINLSRQLRLNAESGMIGMHRFEFYSGDDEIVSNDLEPSPYLRLGLQFNLQ